MSRLFKRSERPSEAVQRAARAHGLSLYYVKYYGKEEVPEAKVSKGVCCVVVEWGGKVGRTGEGERGDGVGSFSAFGREERERGKRERERERERERK